MANCDICLNAQGDPVPCDGPNVTAIDRCDYYGFPEGSTADHGIDPCFTGIGDHDGSGEEADCHGCDIGCVTCFDEVGAGNSILTSRDWTDGTRFARSSTNRNYKRKDAKNRIHDIRTGIGLLVQNSIVYEKATVYEQHNNGTTGVECFDTHPCQAAPGTDVNFNSLPGEPCTCTTTQGIYACGEPMDGRWHETVDYAGGGFPVEGIIPLGGISVANTTGSRKMRCRSFLEVPPPDAPPQNLGVRCISKNFETVPFSAGHEFTSCVTDFLVYLTGRIPGSDCQFCTSMRQGDNQPVYYNTLGYGRDAMNSLNFDFSGVSLRISPAMPKQLQLTRTVQNYALDFAWNHTFPTPGAGIDLRFNRVDHRTEDNTVDPPGGLGNVGLGEFMRQWPVNGQVVPDDAHPVLVELPASTDDHGNPASAAIHVTKVETFMHLRLQLLGPNLLEIEEGGNPNPYPIAPMCVCKIVVHLETRGDATRYALEPGEFFVPPRKAEWHGWLRFAEANGQRFYTGLGSDTDQVNKFFTAFNAANVTIEPLDDRYQGVVRISSPYVPPEGP